MNETLSLMRSSIDRNIVVSGIDEISMSGIISQLSIERNLKNGNFLVDMNLEEVNCIKKIILLLKSYPDHSMDDFKDKLERELEEKVSQLPKIKDAEERKIIKQRIDLLNVLIWVTNNIRVSQPAIEASKVSDEYIIGKLLKSYSENPQIFNLLKVKNYAIKKEHYDYLFNSEVKLSSINASEEERFIWLLDGLIPFHNLKEMRIVNWISNFQNISDIAIQKSLSDIIKKTIDTMRYVILTSSSGIETHKLLKSLDSYGYKEFSLVREKKLGETT
jgi:hypothetical protein